LSQDDLEKLDLINTIVATLKSNGIENTITTIDITNKRDIILELGDDEKQINIGDGSDINTKALYIKKILETEVGHSGTIYIDGDLNEGYVYFREQ